MLRVIFAAMLMPFAAGTAAASSDARRRRVQDGLFLDVVLSSPGPTPPSAATSTGGDVLDKPPPTPLPTPPPILAPTTSLPTSMPTPNPTSEPTPDPTPMPTPGPTSMPTTQEPTLSPTQSPSASYFPSVASSDSPSASSNPTSRPSYVPTDTASPTTAPTDSSPPTSQGRRTGLSLMLEGVRVVEDVSDWENATARFYERAYNVGLVDDEPPALVDAVVEIVLTNQNTFARRRGRTRTLGAAQLLRGERTLQSDDSPASVVVTYTQITTYRSRDPDVDDTEMLKLPLSTDGRRTAYASALMDFLEGYDGLTSVSEISTPDDANRGGADRAVDENHDAGGWSTKQIIGIACVGCGAVLILAVVAGMLVYRRKKRNREEDGEKLIAAAAKSDDIDLGVVVQDTAETSTAASSPRERPVSPLRPVSLIIGGVKATTLGDMSVASEYYPDMGLEVSPAEELVTVYAPSGKLGVVIDSPDLESAPTVHAVKDGSVVAGEVMPGDRLVAVDDVDVRKMSAMEVSKLISKKSLKPRKLTLVRMVQSW